MTSSRALLASGLLAVVTAVWFTAAFRGGEPVGWLWAPSPIGAVILTMAYWRTSRCRQLSLVARRFWRSLAVAGGLVGVASTVQAIDVLRHPQVDGPHLSPVMLSIDAAAVAIIMVALLRLPLGRRTSAERLRVTLDAGTIMAAAAVFIWHFQLRHVVGSANDTALISAGFVVVLALLAVFAVAKVALSSHTYIDKTALRLLALAMLVGSVTSPFAGVIEQRSHLFLNQINIPLVFFIATCAAVSQQRAGTAGPATDARRAGSFSVLPYAAVAAVDALLLAIIWADNVDARVVGGAAVLVTALVVLRQITAFRDNHRLLDELDHSATHDALTQLPNRVLFHQRLHQALTDPTGRQTTVVLIDLNDFKIVNDTLGHAAGDVLLATVAQRLRDCVGDMGTVARLGGDEFAIVMRGRPATIAERMTRDILTRLKEPITVEGRAIAVRASCGIAQGAVGDDPGDLLRRADIAMYQTKARGDGSWTHYTPGMQTRGTKLAVATNSTDDARRGGLIGNEAAANSGGA